MPARPGGEPPAGAPRRRAWGRWLLRAAVSAALLTLVLRRVDADRLGALLARVHWGWWISGLVLMLLAPVLSAQRFRLLIRGLGHRVSLGSVVAINLEATLFNLVVPGELVAGVVRWQRVSRHTGDRARALGLLAAERLIDWVTMALVTAAGAAWLFGGEAAPRLRLATMAAAGACAALGVAAVLAGRSPALLRAVRARRRSSTPRAAPWAARLERLLAAGGALAGDPRRTAAVGLWTLVYMGVAFAGSAMMALAVFPPLPVLPYVAATAALTLLTQLPLTVAGVGLRELSLPLLLAPYGVTRELGLLLGLSAFVPYLGVGLAGLVVRSLGRARLEETAGDGASSVQSR